jgi:hypothetical protein
MRRAPLLAGLLLLGCGIVLANQPLPKPEEGEWPAERDRFTRGVKVYDRFDDKAFATATYQALPVRLARVNRLAEWKRMTPEERAALEATERAEAEKGEEILLAFFTANFAANDLDSRTSVWRVALEVPGQGDLLPSRIEQVRKDATLQTLYPYVGHFDVVYRVRFPRWKGPQPLAEIPFDLRIAGALGDVKLRFGPGTQEGGTAAK